MTIHIDGSRVTRAAKGAPPAKGSAEDPGTLVGVLQTVRYHQNNFLIALVAGSAPGAPACVRGSMICPQVGLEYTLVGAWENHPKFGRQFAFTDYSVSYPTSVDAIRGYLVDTCSGIGRKIADEIVGLYGAGSIDVLRDAPARVAQDVAGLTPDKCARIAAQLREGQQAEVLRLALRDMLGGTKVTRPAIDWIIDLWKQDAPAMIRENPYRLIDEIRGVGFVAADSVAIKLGYDWSGPPRMRAGIVYALEELGRAGGHTCATRERLVGDAVGLLGVNAEAIDAEIDVLENTEKIVTDRDIWPGHDLLYLPAMYRDECLIADKVRELARHTVVAVTPDLNGLQADQVDAVTRACGPSGGVFILTGPPGTGKTFTIKRIVDSFAAGSKVGLAAPTGKSAKRMIEMIGRPASTVHRLLGPDKDASGGWRFKHDGCHPLEFDLIVIDEFSMMDTWLAARLIDAVAVGTRLVLVGDTYQLPAVGPGNVLGDVIASGVIPCAELTVIKRQDPGDIVQNCHRIKDGGDVVIRNGASKDFFVIDDEDQDSIARTIVDLVVRRLPAAYGVDPRRDIQVISPVREKTGMSCAALNDLLQAALAPEESCAKVKGTRFRVGDKVIQLRNEYDLGIINGDIGYVVGEAATEKGSPAVEIMFDAPSRLVAVPVKGNNLDLAYAITVHKSQGSESRLIVMPMHKSFGPMILQRNLIYTAISRAREVCVLVGQRGELSRTIRRNSVISRVTRLRERLSGGE